MRRHFDVIFVTMALKGESSRNSFSLFSKTSVMLRS
jgi:hypothetical protein